CRGTLRTKVPRFTTGAADLRTPCIPGSPGLFCLILSHLKMISYRNSVPPPSTRRGLSPPLSRNLPEGAPALVDSRPLSALAPGGGGVARRSRGSSADAGGPGARAASRAARARVRLLG